MNIATANEDDFKLAFELEEQFAELEQVPLTTHHTLHEGVYTRTVLLQKGTVATGSVIKIPTTVLINGHIRFLIGTEVHNIEGFKAITASANRKQVAYAMEDTHLTMLFKTDAQTIEEAEKEFTDDFDKLMSHNSDATNITQGVLTCQE